jgi:hypothetical protein
MPWTSIGNALRTARVLQALGYTYRGGEWLLLAGAPLLLTAEADAMHGALMRRQDALVGCTDGLDEEAGLKTIVDAIEAYEAKRWPLGKDPNVPGWVSTMVANDVLGLRRDLAVAAPIA